MLYLMDLLYLRSLALLAIERHSLVLQHALLDGLALLAIYLLYLLSRALVGDLTAFVLMTCFSWGPERYVPCNFLFLACFSHGPERS
jgi:hypothetical protein